MKIYSFVIVAHTATAFQVDNVHDKNYCRMPTGSSLPISTREIDGEAKESREGNFYRKEAPSIDRRDCFRQLSSNIFRFGGLRVTCLLSSCLLPGVSSASMLEEETINKSQQQRMAFNKRPKAPTASLIPATQQGLLLEKCLALSEKLLADVDKEDSAIHISKTIEELKSILVDPRTRKSGKDAANPYYTPNLTYQKRVERDQRVLSRYYETTDRTQLSGEVILAAMNAYTDCLTYSSEYTVRDAEWKKSYIRSNGGLPDVEKVVRADMDLRVMYRNQVQLKVDDAAAELFYYSAEADNSDRDDKIFQEFAVEFQQLLQSASNALNQWFDMIDEADVKEALSTIAVVNENTSTNK